jgi:predicted amidophosphoribosyltransferase
MNGFLVESLFDWNSDSDKPLRSLLLKLKGGSAVEAFRFLTEQMALGDLWHREPAVLVPAPASQAMDHALRLALFLAAHKQLPLFLPLERGRSRGSQKLLSKYRRQSVQLVAKAGWQEELTPYKEVIFVDDVVTTGATARRAYEVLGSPRHFRVWALARRSLL